MGKYSAYYGSEVKATDHIQWDQVSAIQKTDPFIYEGFAGAFASFFATADPNAHKLTNASVAGVPKLLPQHGSEFVIESTGFADVPIPQLERRCAFWKSVAPLIPI